MTNIGSSENIKHDIRFSLFANIFFFAILIALWFVQGRTNFIDSLSAKIFESIL